MWLNCNMQNQNKESCENKELFQWINELFLEHKSLRFFKSKSIEFVCSNIFVKRYANLNITVRGIIAVVKIVDSHFCGWGSGKSCSCLIVSLSKDLSLCFMCSDQHVKYRMPREFPLTNSLLLDYHVEQYTHTHWKSICYYFMFSTESLVGGQI